MNVLFRADRIAIEEYLSRPSLCWPPLIIIQPIQLIILTPPADSSTFLPFPCYHFHQPTVIMSFHPSSIQHLLLFPLLSSSSLASSILGLLTQLHLPQTCLPQVASYLPCPGQLPAFCSPSFHHTLAACSRLGRARSSHTNLPLFYFYIGPLTRLIHSVLPACPFLCLLLHFIYQ